MPQDIDDAVRAASEAFKTWKKSNGCDRRDLVGPPAVFKLCSNCVQTVCSNCVARLRARPRARISDARDACSRNTARAERRGPSQLLKLADLVEKHRDQLSALESLAGRKR